jgi:hypothetical protein
MEIISRTQNINEILCCPDLLLDNNFIQGEKYVVTYKSGNNECLELLGEYYDSSEIEYMNSNTWYWIFENGTVTNDLKLNDLLSDADNITNIQFFQTEYSIDDFLKLIYDCNLSNKGNFYRIKRKNEKLLIVNLNSCTSYFNHKSKSLFLNDFCIEIEL